MEAFFKPRRAVPSALLVRRKLRKHNNCQSSHSSVNDEEAAPPHRSEGSRLLSLHQEVRP
jgi:hypothetical protein